MALPAFVDKWLGRFSNLAALWPALPAAVIAAVSGYLSRSVAFISQFGAFGWWTVGILTFVLVSAAFLCIALAWERLATMRALKNWQVNTQSVNPLRNAFDGERISIAHLAHPITHRIERKSFNNCELVGPANVVFDGNGVVSGITFMDCDFVVIRENIHIKNILVFNGCSLLGGTIWNCTVFLTQQTWEGLAAGLPGITPVTYERP